MKKIAIMEQSDLYSLPNSDLPSFASYILDCLNIRIEKDIKGAIVLNNLRPSRVKSGLIKNFKYDTFND